MNEIGQMSHGIWDNATDLADIFNNYPWRRKEFGEREIADLREAHLKLGLLLSAVSTPHLKVVGQ